MQYSSWNVVSPTKITKIDWNLNIGLLVTFSMLQQQQKTKKSTGVRKSTAFSAAASVLNSYNTLHAVKPWKEDHLHRKTLAKDTYPGPKSKISKRPNWNCNGVFNFFELNNYG